jgi:hypothetical protein
MAMGNKAEDRSEAQPIESITLELTLPKRVYDRLDAFAKENLTSVQSAIRIATSEYLDDKGRLR